MIASRDQRRPHLSRLRAWAIATPACLGLLACSAERETTLMRSRRAREAGALRVERLQQQRDTRAGCLRRDLPQVVDQCRFTFGRRSASGNDACHDVDKTDPEASGVVEGRLEAFPEFPFASGHCAETPLARGRVAKRCVEEQVFEPG